MPKRAVYLKKASEETFGDLDELKNASSLAPEFSVKAKIDEADQVFGLSLADFLAKYDDATYGHGVTAASTNEQIVIGKLLVIDKIDDEIKTRAGEDIKAKMGALDRGNPKVHEILQDAKNALMVIDAETFGGDAEKQLYIRHLEKFGLDLNDKEIQKKAELAIELKSRIREQKEKETELALEKLRLEQLKQDAKDIDVRYGDYGRVGWKVAKILGITAAAGAASIGAAPLAMAGAGLLAVGSFAPQLDFGISKTWNKVKQWWVGDFWSVPGKEKAKKKADMRVQNIQQSLSLLQNKENLKKTVIEADIARQKERRNEIDLEMKPIKDELLILRAAPVPDIAKITDATERLIPYQRQLREVDTILVELEKALTVFSIAEKHREKLGSGAAQRKLLNTIAGSEYLPGSSKKKRELYEAPDTRSVESQMKIKKMNPNEVRYLIGILKDQADVDAIADFIGVGGQLKDGPNPAANLTSIDSLGRDKLTLPLYNLLVSLTKLAKDNEFRKAAIGAIETAYDERVELENTKSNLKKINPAHLKTVSAIKDLYKALSDDKKKDIEKAFAKISPWNNPANVTQKERYDFFESVKKLPADNPYRRAALKKIEEVLKDKGIL